MEHWSDLKRKAQLFGIITVIGFGTCSYFIVDYLFNKSIISGISAVVFLGIGCFCASRLFDYNLQYRKALNGDSNNA